LDGWQYNLAPRPKDNERTVGYTFPLLCQKGKLVCRMRIVEVNPFHYPFLGGIEHRVHHISKRLAKRHEMIVLTSQLEGTSNEEVIDGYRVVRLPSRYIDVYNPPYVSTKGLMEALKGLDPDLVDFHYRWAPDYNKLAREWPGKKVFTFHNTFGEGVGVTRLPSLINDQMLKRHLKKFPRVICVSEYVKKDLDRRGFNPNRTVAIPNGIEIPCAAPQAEEDFILFMGRLVNTKGLEYLVKAMRSVDSKLIICGGGPLQDKLKRHIEKNNLSGKVELTGRVCEEKKCELLSSCKLFVMPSIFESYGIAVAEAMSYGKAIIATNVGGLPEVVKNAGLLCEPKNVESLAQAINRLLHEDELRSKMALISRTLATSYTWDSIQPRVQSEYESIMGA
jgi:glycosyltransferase involved in cell wall biosynthesis